MGINGWAGVPSPVISLALRFARHARLSRPDFTFLSRCHFSLIRDVRLKQTLGVSLQSLVTSSSSTRASHCIASSPSIRRSIPQPPVRPISALDLSQIFRPKIPSLSTFISHVRIDPQNNTSQSSSPYVSSIVGTITSHGESSIPIPSLAISSTSNSPSISLCLLAFSSASLKRTATAPPSRSPAP
jgi:hypothetical protein